jgi:tetratricopeptide (TPR) repeat protein
MRCEKLKIVAALMLTAAVAGGRAAERPWTLIRGEHATIVGRQSAKTLRDVAFQIEQFRAVVGALIPNARRPLPLPTVVYVFDTSKDMLPFVPIYNGKPTSLGGYFHHDSEVNYIALDLEGFAESARIVYHEYTHLLLENATGSIPAWLNEGLAEYYSTYSLAGNGKKADIGLAVARHVAQLRERFIPLSELIAVDHSSALYNEGDRRSIFYAESWALTHYLMIEMPEGPKAINAYATAIARGQRPDDAFVTAFGMTPAAFEKTLRAYVRQMTFRAVEYTFPERIEVEAFGKEENIPVEETGAWLGDLQRRIRRVDEAAVRIEASAKAAPAAAMPNLALALLRTSQSRAAEARPAFERAAARAPDDFLVQYTYGVTLLREHHAQGAAGKSEDIDRARAVLTRAAAINPNSSEAFAWLAYAEMVSDNRLPQARAAIARAIELAPGRLDYHLRSADISVLDDKLNEATAQLTQLARVTTDTSIADAAKARLAQIDEHKSRVAARAAAMQAAAASAAAAFAEANARRGPDAPDEPREPEPEPRSFRMRTVQRNEQRAYGELAQIDCAGGRVRFHLKVGSRDIVATAASMDAVTLTNFTGAKDFAIACGRREPADTVYMTWRLATPREENGSTIVGVAIAVEFVPRGYTP